MNFDTTSSQNVHVAENLKVNGRKRPGFPRKYQPSLVGYMTVYANPWPIKYQTNAEIPRNSKDCPVEITGFPTKSQQWLSRQ